jgi:hypothetical protein
VPRGKYRRRREANRSERESLGSVDFSALADDELLKASEVLYRSLPAAGSTDREGEHLRELLVSEVGRRVVEILHDEDIGPRGAIQPISRSDLRREIERLIEEARPAPSTVSADDEDRRPLVVVNAVINPPSDAEAPSKRGHLSRLELFGRILTFVAAGATIAGEVHQIVGPAPQSSDAPAQHVSAPAPQSPSSCSVEIHFSDPWSEQHARHAELVKSLTDRLARVDTDSIRSLAERVLAVRRGVIFGHATERELYIDRLAAGLEAEEPTFVIVGPVSPDPARYDFTVISGSAGRSP